MATTKKLYTGKELYQSFSKTFKEKDGKDKTIKLNPYLPNDSLIDAVNIAILLDRPLLVMGEPGCGKSLLAHAVAYELYQDQKIDSVVQNYTDWFFEWNIKSTSKAKEGFYEYEALKRLLDVQLASVDEQARERAGNTTKYIEERAMALAIKKSTEENRAILLIDEIDKADPDFPNDLLNELEKGEHRVVETGKLIVENPVKPIIIITSNREKELPDAFLRRCVYYFIPNFSPERLKEILSYRFFKIQKLPEEHTHKSLLEQSVKAFKKAKEEIEGKKTSGKTISTSELIDWFETMKKWVERGIDKKEIADFATEIEKYVKGDQPYLPLQQALFKNYETIKIFEKVQKDV
jgi:MoxR-like ATPase